MKASEYVDIGLYLRDSRQSLRISLEQAAHDLHIRAKYLKAIESGELEVLPGKAYIRGYIRNYASYLHLSVEEVLSAYEALLASKAHDFFVPEPTLRQNLPSAKAIRWSAVGLVLLYGYWYFAVHDRTGVDSGIASIPARFMQLLDKTPYDAMDVVWEACLNSGDSGCFIALYAQAATTTNENALYDISLSSNSPRKP